jgi:FAD:protein FMN transferase
LIGTHITITLFDYNDKTVLEEAFDLIKKYENIFSGKIPESEIYLINNSKGLPVEISDETRYVIEKSLEYSELSNGIFDITIEAVNKFWNFTAEHPSLPNHEDILNGINHVGYENILLDGNIVTLLDSEAMLDVGGIAKGFIADEIKDMMLEKGVKSAIINLGGNIITIGSKKNSIIKKKDFVVGVRDPIGTRTELLGILEVSDKTVVTSGIHERSFIYEDNFYHHILDPKTGYPAKSDILGVTIITDKSIDADALSTITFMLGEKKGIELIESIGDVEAIFVTEDNVSYTSGVLDKFKFRKV